MIVVRSTSNDLFSRKGSSVLNHRYYKDDDTDKDNDQYVDNDYRQQSTNRRNRYSSYEQPLNNHRTRSRSRWPSSYDDSHDSHDWPRYSNLDSLISDYHGLFPSTAPVAFDNGPHCHSLLDPQYPIFSDICGAVPQARYSLPNSFGHRERWQIAEVLSTVLDPSTSAFSPPSCTRSLRLLLCPLLFSPCPTRYEAAPVLPCQPFCQAIKNQCRSPTLDLLPCDLLPLTSDLCPINPTPYSSLLSSFTQPLPFRGGSPQSTLSSILAQSALPQFDAPSSAFASFLPPSGLSSSRFSSLQPRTPMPSSTFSSPPFSSFLPSAAMPSSAMSSSFNPLLNMESYMDDVLTPVLVDLPPLPITQDYRQAPRFFPATRSATGNTF